MATSKSKVTLKLLTNKKECKVLFAEANKDFVDFLFYIFSLPLGRIVKLLKIENMVGCLGELHQSIETLSESYKLSNQSKNSVLNLKSPLCPTEIPLLLPDENDHYEPKDIKFYTCSNTSNPVSARRPTSTTSPFDSSCSRHLYVADTPNRACPSCSAIMNSEMTFVSPDPSVTSTAAAVAERGFVKDTVSYMVMDNLEVTAMSTISCITLLNKFNVMDLGSLEEKVVDFGLDEGLKLLKASMECNNVLTSVFFGNMEA